MRGNVFRWVTLLIVFLPCLGRAWAAGPPTVLPGGAGPQEALPLGATNLVEAYQLKINGIPYLLSRYLDSGDLLVVQSIYDAMESVDLNMKKMGESITSVRHKEIFAKLMAGTQKLKQIVEKSLKSIDHYLRLKRVFDYRSSQLVIWLEDQADEAFAQGPGQNAEDLKGLLSTVRQTRITLLKAVSLSGPAVLGSLSQPQRDKSRALWDTASKDVDQLVTQISSEKHKAIAAALALSVHNLRRLERSLAAQIGEVKQGWDETVLLVGSLESLMQPAPAGDKAPGEVPPKEQDPAKARDRGAK
ncbi:MAG: hypothetical protein AB1646_23730 [Thermodesulfobacteriota bacterium]